MYKILELTQGVLKLNLKMFCWSNCNVTPVTMLNWRQCESVSTLTTFCNMSHN